ncbi:phospholipase A2 [Nonomuraea dietziae]|uniref:Fibronectin type 3 domain-containing protein n=2 Tax=Nonomuraea dietziae TaxID=65515 RepID=A0A7W5V228_9ACTN|nr:phospholipase A2 [Nonomuraea dietziae]MBB3727409.1 fibronectin type 3 domain-containing protein [Nonomuraea dietziae]
MPRIRRLLATFLSTALLLAPVVAPAPASANTQVAAATIPATDMAVMWGAYGNQGGHWTGGDATVTIPLPDGRIAWIYADTFLGEVNADFSRPRDAPFINNSMVVQSGTTLGPTLHGGTAQAPTALVDTPEHADDFFWVGDGTVEGNQLKVIYGRYIKTEDNPPLGFARQGTALATFTLPDLTLSSVRMLPVNADMGWGSALLEEGGFSYIYGSEYAEGAKFAHVARAPAGELGGPWQYWTGSGWSDRESDSARLHSGVGEGMSVSKIGSQYVMVTQENNDVFSGWIVAYAANSPTGPFSGPTYLYEAPEPEVSNRSQFIYVGRHHPELADPGELFLSYDVNAWNGEDHYRDVRIYRPRFKEIAWPPKVSDPTPAPGAPTNLKVRAGSDGINHLTWSAPSGTNLNYWVYKKNLTLGQTHFTRTGNPATSTQYGDPFVRDGHTYAYQIRAINQNGTEGPASTPASATGRLAVPPAPTGLTATAGQAGEVKVAWTMSEPGTNYRLYRRDVTEGETVFTEHPLDDPYAVTGTIVGLQIGHTYEFKVTAYNQVGESPPSNLVQAKVAFQAPAAPRNLSATALADGSVKLAWTAPPGGAVNHWIHLRDVTSGATGFTRHPFPVSGQTTTLTELFNGHTYEFKVTAANDGGEGPPSAVATATVRLAPPAAVIGLTATPQSDGSIKLSWSAAERAKSYWVYRRDVTFGHEQFSRYHQPFGATTATLNDLHDGNVYEFKVAAVGDGGEGPAGAVVTATAKVTPPGAPTGLKAEAGSGTVKLTWTPPVGAQMYWVYQRDITAGESGFTRLPYPTSVLSASLEGLANGHTYEYKVSGINQAGEGTASDTVQAKPQPPKPAKVTGVTAQAQADGTVKLAWTPIDGAFYWVSYRDITAGQSTDTRLEYPATGPAAHVGPFTAGHQYDFRITGTNSAGDGLPSDPVRVTIQGAAAVASPAAMLNPTAIPTKKLAAAAAAELPRPPSGLTVTGRGNGYVDLAWVNSLDHPAVYYWVQFRSVGKSTWYNLPYPTLDTTYRVTKPLWNGFEYEFRVVAENQTGASSPTNVVRAAPGSSPPSRPTGLTIASRDHGVELQWTRNSTEDFYWVEFKSAGTGTWYRLNYPAVSNEATITYPLWNGYNYDFRIVALNAAGESQPSAAVTGGPRVSLPPQPSTPTGSSRIGYAHLSWVLPGPINHHVFYWLYYRPYGSTSWTKAKYPIANLSIDLKYLPPGRYQAKVSAVNMAGEGPHSGVETVRILPTTEWALASLTENTTASWNTWLSVYPSPAGTLYDGYDFDWSNDLCSWAVDRPVLRLIPYQRVDWRSSCARHDFGYRNYKAIGKWNYNRKLRLDRLMLADMYRACDVQIRHANPECRALAGVYYTVVRQWNEDGDFDPGT